MAFIELPRAEVIMYLPEIWNIFFKPIADDDFFVEPWDNRALRDCAEFHDNGGEAEFRLVITDPTLLAFLRASTGEIFLYGAYNQIDVCQMRARGTVEVSTEPVPEDMKKRLWTNIRSRVDSLVNKLRREEAVERWRILRTGALVRFHISSCAYRTYERG